MDGLCFGRYFGESMGGKRTLFNRITKNEESKFQQWIKPLILILEIMIVDRHLINYVSGWILCLFIKIKKLSRKRLNFVDKLLYDGLFLLHHSFQVFHIVVARSMIYLQVRTRRISFDWPCLDVTVLRMFSLQSLLSPMLSWFEKAYVKRMTLLSLGFAFVYENGWLVCHCSIGSSLKEFLRFGFRSRDWNEKGVDDMKISKNEKKWMVYNTPGIRRQTTNFTVNQVFDVSSIKHHTVRVAKTTPSISPAA